MTVVVVVVHTSRIDKLAFVAPTGGHSSVATPVCAFVAVVVLSLNDCRMKDDPHAVDMLEVLLANMFLLVRSLCGILLIPICEPTHVMH